MGNLHERLFCNHSFHWAEKFLASVEWFQRSYKRNEFCIKFSKPWLMLLSWWNFIGFSGVICIYVVMTRIIPSKIFHFCRWWLVTSLLNSSGLLPRCGGNGRTLVTLDTTMWDRYDVQETIKGAACSAYLLWEGHVPLPDRDPSGRNWARMLAAIPL